MQKYKITKVYASDEKKDGTKIVNKWGKPAWRVGIKTEQTGEEWLNGFLPFNPTDWEGTERELEVTESEFNGKMQKNFAVPKKEDAALAKLEVSIKEVVTGMALMNSKLDRVIEALDVQTPKEKLDSRYDSSVENFKEASFDSTPDDIESPF